MKTVLYLSCPAGERADVERQLGSAGLAVLWADNVAAVTGELHRRDVTVLLDLSRGAAALQTAQEIRAQSPSALVFAVADSRRSDLTTEAVLAGMADVFDRPLVGRRVVTAIERERGGGVQHVSEDLYSHSPAMRDVVAAIARAASQRGGVLVHGEEGTGRQVAARAIHAAQNGGASAFICVDCADDAGDLEGRLFGHPGKSSKHDERDGAGRGLERVVRGSLLYAARTGTLYLQNIADAPTKVQARLARLLRDREAVIDGGDSMEFDLRPITGVDAAFDGLVAEGRVRDDLFKRLSTIRIEMPPLRSRREDIPVLANRFLREICAAERVPPKTLSRPALALIGALPWRGNAVELRTLLQSIVSGLQGGRNIGLEDVLAHVRLDGGAVSPPISGTLKQARATFERDYIAATLERHHGRIKDAARSLGIQRTNLYRKMRSLRIKGGRS